MGKKNYPTCGDAGGTNAHGEPCRVRVQNEGERCHYHPEIQGEGPPDSVKADVQKAIEAILEDAAGRVEDVVNDSPDCPSYATIRRRVTSSPELTELWDAAVEARRPTQFERLTESMLERAISGKTSAAETIYLHVNLARQLGQKDRWQDLRRLDVTSGGTRLALGAARALLGDGDDEDEVPESIPEPVVVRGGLLDGQGNGNGAHP